jgi:hypothetical protein
MKLREAIKETLCIKKRVFGLSTYLTENTVRHNYEMCVGIHVVVRHSVVSVATRYELDGPGIESQRGRDFFAPVQARRGAHSASYTMVTSTPPPQFLHGSFQGGPLLLFVGIHEKCPLFLSDFNQTFI